VILTFACERPLISAASRIIRCSQGLLIARNRETSGASGFLRELAKESTITSYSERAGNEGERYLRIDFVVERVPLRVEL
jgi:hypothetical protein